MDRQTYQQEYQKFSDWLVQTGHNQLPPDIQAAMWQGWLAKTMSDMQLLAETKRQPKRPLHPQLAEYLNLHRGYSCASKHKAA